MFKKIQQALGVTKEGEKNVVESLYEIPKKEKGKDMPSYKRGGAEPFNIYSADLLTMPEDRGYNILLVVVDTITGLTDAVPLKNKEAKTVLEGFKEIFNKRVLPKPKWSIQVDSGSEFHGVVKKYFDDNGILVRYGKPDRSRQQAMAENRNKLIAKALFQKQVGQEIVTNKTNTEWVDDVQKVLDAINAYERDNYKKEQIRRHKRLKNGIELPYLNPKEPILEIGVKVRTKLDKPKGVLGEKLHGTFRATDIRWEPKIKTITNIILTPRQPVMYQVDDEKTGYTRLQLQVVDGNEKPPQAIQQQQQKPQQQKIMKPEAVQKIATNVVQQVTRSGRVVNKTKVFSI
jgi:hypothetical protein